MPLPLKAVNRIPHHHAWVWIVMNEIEPSVGVHATPLLKTIELRNKPASTHDLLNCGNKVQETSCNNTRCRNNWPDEIPKGPTSALWTSKTNHYRKSLAHEPWTPNMKQDCVQDWRHCCSAHIILVRRNLNLTTRPGCGMRDPQKILTSIRTWWLVTVCFWWASPPKAIQKSASTLCLSMYVHAKEVLCVGQLQSTSSGHHT